MSEAGCWSSDEQCEIYTQRQKEFQMVCLKLREENKNSNPFEVSPVKSKSTVIVDTEIHADGGMIKSSVTAGVSKVSRSAGPVVKLSGVSEVKRKAVRYIPNYSKEISCSKEECYNALKNNCAEHEFILEGVSSSLYTTACWYRLRYNLQLMNPDDTSKLHLLSKMYFVEHSLPKDRILKEFDSIMTRLRALISMYDSIDKYNAMTLSELDLRCILVAMDKVNGWSVKRTGEREKSVYLWDYSLKYCTEWLKHRESVHVQTKEPTVKEVSNESQWLRDFSNKYFYDSSDDEEDGHSAQNSSSSSYDGYGSDSYEDCDESVRDGSEDDAISDYGSESGWNSDQSNGDY
jgi:hypothetical protein